MNVVDHTNRWWLTVPNATDSTGIRWVQYYDWPLTPTTVATDHTHTGWECPRCDRVNSPDIEACPCSVNAVKARRFRSK